ncbi:hypothetical protein, partial [Akkermansia sp.]|uniref:hypothetical protein n=1 Tax=Akkermansia sp. TaxID=1872421 RepID=UPI003AB4B69F
ARNPPMWRHGSKSKNRRRKPGMQEGRNAKKGGDEVSYCINDIMTSNTRIYNPSSSLNFHILLVLKVLH